MPKLFKFCGTRFDAALVYLCSVIALFIPFTLDRVGVPTNILPCIELYVIFLYVVYYPIGYLWIMVYAIVVSEIYGTPIFVDIILMTTTYALCMRARNILLSKKPISVLFGFIVVAIVFLCTRYIVLSQYFNYWFDKKIFVLQIFTTILFFPAIEQVAHIVSHKVLQYVK